jgi:hypothetical protein
MEASAMGIKGKGFKAWAGTAAIAAALGAIVLSAHSRQADAAPIQASEDERPAPLDQADNDPPFGSFLGACNGDSDCSEGNACQSFRKRGSHCTHACESGSDCAGTRCTKQGRCGLNDPVKTTK